MTRKLKILLTDILLVFGTAYAQSIQDGPNTRHWETAVSAGLNTDGYDMNVFIAWFPNQHIGLKASIGVAGEIEAISDWGWYYDGYYDEFEYYDGGDDDYTIRFKFTPAVVMRSPRIIPLSRSDADGFYIFAEPGLVLSPGAAGSKGAKVCCYDIRAGINLQLGEFILSAGYGYSNFNLYSGCPISHYDYDTPLPSHRTHSGYLSAAFKF